MGSILSSFSSPSPLSLPSPSSSSFPSPSSPSLEIKYDVFLNFRGKDTRNTFTSHLHKALCDQGIDVFIDYELRRGNEISPSLLQAIEESMISIVIFSENYAYSKWCLEELVKILECKKNHGQIVIPVFYEIDPSHVRNQSGSFADAFVNHEEHFKEDLNKVQKWRCALMDVANISGSDSRVIMPESKLVENIVEDVLKSLKETMLPSDNKELIGIDSSIAKLETMLGRGSVGLWGIGGIGKTTLAYALFEKMSCQFDCSYFTDSVREASKQHLGLKCLRQGLLYTLLGDENAHIGTLAKIRLQRKKFFFVLDDVSDLRQVEFLIGNPSCLDSKSQIIITSRDKQVLKNCCMDENIYEVKELCFSNALKFFCRNAFRQNCPKVDYRDLSDSIVKMVGGVPLALKVLGSSLLGKTKEVWESTMEKVAKNFDGNIHAILKISYEELDDDQQNIFLDIACFFKWWNIDLVKAFMKACGFFPDSGIDTLVDKSLITISNNMLTMHDLLQAMGKEIVRQESINDPSKRSRLWHHKDVYDVLTNEMGTKTLEGIFLNMSKLGDIHIHPRAFANMQNLRFLHFGISNHGENRVHVSQGIESVFTHLRYLHWHGCPLKSLQSNFLSKDLVVLKMRSSKVRELWSGVPQLDNLQIIDLSGSQYLTSLPDLSRAPSLEILRLEYCESLTEIPSSIQHLPKLHTLLLHACENLMSIPDCNGLKSLHDINVDSCYKLKVLPRLPNNFTLLHFSKCTSLREIPSSYEYLNKLKFLYLKGCKSLTSISDYSGLKSLTELTIKGCSKVKMLPEFPNTIERLGLMDIPIEELPSSLENLCRLWELDLCDCSRLKSLPSSVCKLKRLRILCLRNCSKIDKLPDDIGTSVSLEEIKVEGTAIREVPSSLSSLKSLYYLSFSRCEVFPSLIGLDNLHTLSLSDCGIVEIPDSLSCLTSLEYLHLDKNNFASIPESIINLSKLWYLNISNCERLKVLPNLPWAEIIAVNCTSLEEISCPSFQYDIKYIMVANFVNCFKLDRNSLNNFAKDALLDIQGQAASTNKIFNHQVDRAFPPPITICYPDSEIPEWFEYQNKGSFIDVNLPPNWFNYNFLCFALCIVVAISSERQFVHNGDSLCVECECNAKSKDGDHFFYMLNSELDYSTSNHVEIGFGFHYFREHYGNQLSFQFYLKDRYSCNIASYNVEKSGVHLIYGQHLEILDEKDEGMNHIMKNPMRMMNHILYYPIRKIYHIPKDLNI